MPPPPIINKLIRWRCSILLGCLTLGILPVAADAQKNSIAFEFGVIEYDAGGDLTYPLYVLHGGREVLPWLRLGIGMSLADIGDIPRGVYFDSTGMQVIFTGSETLWRGYATATAIAHRPFRTSGVPLLDQLSPEAGVGLGIVHSAGLTLNPDVFSDPFNGIEDQPSGLALGISLALGIEISTVVALRVTTWYWSDHLWGDALDDFQLTGGVAVRW